MPVVWVYGIRRHFNTLNLPPTPPRPPQVWRVHLDEPVASPLLEGFPSAPVSYFAYGRQGDVALLGSADGLVRVQPLAGRPWGQSRCGPTTRAEVMVLWVKGFGRTRAPLVQIMLQRREGSTPACLQHPELAL